MIGDEVRITARQRRLATELVAQLAGLLRPGAGRHVVAIAGESGSGKTTLALALCEALTDRGRVARVLQQDDYFVLPPLTNAARRREAIDAVGEGEVDLALLDAHLEALRQGAPRLTKPLVIYAEDRIAAETLELADVAVIVVEGTYVFGLRNVDLRIFIDRDYRQTLAARRRRGRDPIDAFGERVLRREHALIAPQLERADLVIDAELDGVRAARAEATGR